MLGRDRFHIGQKTRAAEYETASVDATKPPSFLTRADLAHFDTAAEATGRVADQFSEIVPVISCVNKGQMSAVQGSVGSAMSDSIHKFRLSGNG